MIVLNNLDAIRAIASVTNVVSFSIHGHVGTTPTPLADGLVTNAEADLYASGADGTNVNTIVLVNTHSAAVTVNMYRKANGGTSRSIIPEDLSLGVGHSLHTDGRHIVVLDTTGQIINGWAVDDTAGGTNGMTTVPISSNVMYDHTQAADPHTGYILESLLDAKGDVIAASADNTPAKVTVGANGTVFTADSAQAAGVKWAVVSGAEVAYKTANETVNNSAALQNDDHLLLAVGANEIWIAEFTLLLWAASSTADWKFGFSYPAGCSLYFANSGGGANVASGPCWSAPGATGTIIALAVEGENIQNAGQSNVAGATGGRVVVLIINGATAGNVNFQWAQNTATVENNTILANSCMVAHKIA